MTDLLIVGGLTIDRFADGSSAPGGSVIHAGRAAAAQGVRPAILTVAGDEPEAAVGLGQLADIGDVIHQRTASTVTFGHDEVDGRRALTYLAGAGPIAPPALVDAPDVALLAPIADELPATAVAAIRDTARPRTLVMLLQGWLRRLELAKPVRPIALDEVPATTWDAFATADAVVVSTEDLAEAPGDPFAEAAAVRSRLGSNPVLILTLGAEGYLLDDPRAADVVAHVPRRVIDGVSMVGAGDTFGVTLALQLGAGAAPAEAALAATDRVVGMLEERR